MKRVRNAASWSEQEGKQERNAPVNTLSFTCLPECKHRISTNNCSMCSLRDGGLHPKDWRDYGVTMKDTHPLPLCKNKKVRENNDGRSALS